MHYWRHDKKDLRKVLWFLRSLKQHGQKQVRGFTLYLPWRATLGQEVAQPDSRKDQGCLQGFS